MKGITESAILVVTYVVWDRPRTLALATITFNDTKIQPMRTTILILTILTFTYSCSQSTKTSERETTNVYKEKSSISFTLDKLHKTEQSKDTLGHILMYRDSSLILGHSPIDIWDKPYFKKYMANWFPKPDSKPWRKYEIESRIIKLLDDGKTAVTIEHFQMGKVRLMTRHIAVLTKIDTSWMISFSSYDYALFDEQEPKVRKSLDDGKNVTNSTKN